MGRNSEPCQGASAILRDGGVGPGCQHVAEKRMDSGNILKKSQQDLLPDMVWGMGERKRLRLTLGLWAAGKDNGH